MNKITYPLSSIEATNYLIKNPDKYVQNEFYQDGEVLHSVQALPDNDKIHYLLKAKFDENGELHDYPLNQLSKRQPEGNFRVVKDMNDAFRQKSS